MVAAASFTSDTLPLNDPAAPPKKRKRRGWAPDATDHLVYQWVTFEGKRQTWVATAIGVDQSTVSRIVQRYEKWQAHATPATDGRLSDAERKRAQRWLTFQRNELIIASSLRIAHEMEGFIDVSKSVLSHPAGDPAAQREVRTEHMVVDRSAIAARFLRLVHRINMDQLKLSEKEPLPDLPPLNDEEVAEQEADAAAVTRQQEATAARAQASQAYKARIDAEVAQAVAAEVERRVAEIIAASEQPQADESESELPIRASDQPAVVELNLHNLHTCITPETIASADPDETYEPNRPPELPAAQACIAARSDVQSG